MKTDLRAQLRATRNAFVAERLSNGLTSDFIIEIIRKHLVYNDKCVAIYCAKGSECDVMTAIVDATSTGAISTGAAIALPCAASKAEPLIFRRWHKGDALITGPLGLKEPLPGAEEIAPDVILAPLLGFDRALNRLGQGAGHYDRAFAAFPHALRIGIAWSCQEVTVIPTDAWDLPLDGVITEKEWIAAPHQRIF